MRRAVLAAALVLPLVAGCASGRAGPPTLAGRWAPERAELGGRPFAIAAFQGATLELTADAYAFGDDRGSYTAAGGRAPAAMDVRGRVGPNAGRTIPALYARQGDALTIAYQLGDGARPATLASPAGSQVLVVHYRRVP